MGYLDWLQAVLESNSRCAWKWISTELRDTLQGCDRASLEMHFEALIERVWRCTLRPWSGEWGDAIGGRDHANLEAINEQAWRCTLRPWSSEFGDELWGHDRASLEMQLETVIVPTWRPESGEFGDALWGHDRVSFEMQLETEIEWTQRCTGWPWSSEFGHALGGQHRVNLEMHSVLWLSEFRDALAVSYDWGRWEEYLEVVHLEADDGRRARCWDSIHGLVKLKPWECDEVTLPLNLLWRTAWWQWIRREVRWKLHSGVNSKSREWRDDRHS